MTRRMIFPVLLGAFGVAILLWLGSWQVHRLAWKETMLAAISAQIEQPAMALDLSAVDIAHQKYRSVQVSGTLTPKVLRVLTSRPPFGPGYRLIARLDVTGGSILIDLGFTPQAAPPAQLPHAVTIVGNIMWPEETDSYTPKPNLDRNIWFARDVPAMANTLATQKLMVVARRISPKITGVLPWPVDIAGIPNNHLQYAITWFSLAVLWLGMTGYWLWRIRQRLD